MAPFKSVPFENTPVESIPGIVSRLKATFRQQKTKPLEYRLQQLRKLYWAIVDNSEALEEAFKLDLGKPKFEVYTGEVDWCKNDIVYITKNLEKWMKDEPAKDVPLTYSLLNAKIRKEPLGTVLVIGAFNYPINLALGPLIGAIAAGCPGVLKPSELSPNVAMLVAKIVEESLDPSAYAVVNGGVAETTALLNEKWEKIFYTGGTVVGTIVAKKAAETLTPVVLELGGRNPAIVSRNADPRIAARRLIWGKLLNAGQVCLSQNYILVDKEILPAFVEQLKIALKEFFPKGQKASPDFGRIVNNRHFQRIKKMLDDTKGQILVGGEVDEEENYISTTIVQVKDHNDSMISDESFGPLMPLLAVDNIDQALQIATEVDPTPLGFYPFGNKAEISKMLNEFTSGGASVNDSFFHASINNVPFGGVGTSGQGAYRGQASFEAFTHRRSITTTPGWMESLVSVRYPPYDGKLEKFQASAGLKPNFDRQGREIKGAGYWLKFLFTLGGSSSKSALMRWAVVALVAVGLKKKADANTLPSWLK